MRRYLENEIKLVNKWTNSIDIEEEGPLILYGVDEK